MPDKCSYIGLPHRGRTVYFGYRCQLVCGGGVLNQVQEDREVVIAFASRSLRLSQRRNCMTCREMLAAVVMCTHFRSYLRGAQFTLRMDHSSLRWLQKFRNSDGMLARWYMLLGQFSVTFEYRPGAQHANADGMTQVGAVRSGPCVVGMCGIISGAAVLAATGRESVGGHGGEVIVSPSPSGVVLSAGRFRTTGSHSPFS